MKTAIDRVVVGVACVVAAWASSGSSNASDVQPPQVSLRPNLLPSPIKRLTGGVLEIVGETACADGTPVFVRVTTSAGEQHQTHAAAERGRFRCRYPADFPQADPSPPLVLYVDATTARAFGDDPVAQQAEITLVLAGDDPAAIPDLPLVFTDDFLDPAGRQDRDSAGWQRQRTLVNLFMRGRAAALMHIRRQSFDLDVEQDERWFKSNATLYDFDHRDRDWTTGLGHRVARGFWQAMWNNWFNATNNHHWDGNSANTAQANYRPYAFANDVADLLILYEMVGMARPVVQDNRVALRRDIVANLLAMQHRGPETFALGESAGRRLQYTAGAFRYGLFETGEFLTEGTGWFANPKFRDFDYGGVLNGRCLWALGTALAADPTGPQAEAIRAAIPLTLGFCLRDAIEHGYARRTKGGHAFWGYPGEHGYLVLGMLAANRVAPDLPIPVGPGAAEVPLRTVCIDSLDALVEATLPDGTWSPYGNVDAVNISALCAGALQYPEHPRREAWRAAARSSADVWLALRPLASERVAPTPLFGIRKGDGMTFYLGKEGLPHFALYLNGHWLEALAKLFAVTGEDRFRDRARAILAYYCGDNPLHVRLLSEIGSVNNRVTDRDANGCEDHLGWDAYPESTAFVQIGLLELLTAEAGEVAPP